MHFIPPPLRRSTTTSKIEEIDGSEDMDVVETILENDGDDKDENLDAELEEELSELN